MSTTDPREALRVIAGWPITDPSNMDAANMRAVAQEALGEPVQWPKDAKDVRAFFRDHYESMTYAREDEEPCIDDRYLISAHDFLSAIRWWSGS